MKAKAKRKQNRKQKRQAKANKKQDLWPYPQYPLLADGIDAEETVQHGSPTNARVVVFPSKERCRVLHVGCGNSQLGEQLLNDGFMDVVNVDYSEVLIKKMQAKYNAKFFEEMQSCMGREVNNHHDTDKSVRTPQMTFEYGDITEGIHYQDEAFDLIICKNTLDVILCGAGSVANTRSMMNECFRLLSKDHGVLMIISSANPDDRAIFCEEDPWSGVVNIKLPSMGDRIQPRDPLIQSKQMNGYGRYARETEPCDWIIPGYSVFQHLLTPTFLAYTEAPPPGGEIIVGRLGSWALSTDGVNDEEARQHESPTNGRVITFPSKESCRVLHVGCGNSQLGEKLLKHGFTNIVNVDYSEVLIKKMQAKYNAKFFAEMQSCMEREEMLRNSLGLVDSRDDKNHHDTAKSVRTPQMTFECGDITEGIRHPDEAFDLIICKKTLDIILCGAGSVADARSMMSECFRLLNKVHGVLMIVSSAKPEDRAVYFEADPWSGVVNIKLPSKDDYGQFNQRKGNER
ncbi:hypothetical protein ACHAXR_012604 [Thalassiosira sp. AJA248-18]